MGHHSEGAIRSQYEAIWVVRTEVDAAQRKGPCVRKGSGVGVESIVHVVSVHST